MRGAIGSVTVIILWCCSVCCILGVQLAGDAQIAHKPSEKKIVGSNKEEPSSSSGELSSGENEKTFLLERYRGGRSVEKSVVVLSDQDDVTDDDDNNSDDKTQEALGIFDEKRSSDLIPAQTSSSSNRTQSPIGRNNNNNKNRNDEEDDDTRSTELVDMFKTSASSAGNRNLNSEERNSDEEPLEPVTVAPPTTEISPRGDQEEKILLQYLMRGYERDVRPVRNSSHPVVIEVGITLTQIFDMDEKNQVLTTNVWLDQEWNDELLRWDPADFGGLDSIRLPCERIWLPDIVLYNNADDYTQGYMPSRAMVSHDGKVFWPPPTKFRSTCPVDVTYFPFDDQICTLKLGSWTYNGFQVDVMNRTAEVDLSNYVSNGEWELLEAELQRNVVYYSCCPEPFPDVTITLIIRRKTLYYIYNIVLPCVMLSALTLLVFCLPPDSGEKIALGITVLLAFSVFMLAIAEKMPETSESIPLIGIYLTAVMAITSVSVIVTVVVLNLHYLGPQVKSVPLWLRWFLPKDKRRRLESLGAAIRQKSWLIPATHREPRSGSLKRSHVMLPPNRLSIESYTGLPTTNSTRAGDHLQYHHHHLHHHHPLESGMDMIKKPLKECSSTESMTNENAAAATVGKSGARSSINYHLHSSSSASSNPGATAQNTSSGLHQRHHRHSKGLDHTKDVPPPNTTLSDSSIDISTLPPTGTNGPGSAAGDVQEELLRSIRHLIGKQEEVEAQNLMVSEWRLIAQAIDRILFWIFTTVTLVSSAVFLLILPLYKRSWNGPNPPSSSSASSTTAAP